MRPVVDRLQAAAGLTDACVLMMGLGLLRSLHAGTAGTADRVLMGTGAGMFAVSVPLQFSADALLSRAVWWHNSTLGR